MEMKLKHEDSTPSSEQLEAKQDEIEMLQDMLVKEKANLSEALRECATFKEELKIAQETTQKAIEEKKNFAEKHKTIIHKVEELQDKLRDKELIVDEYDAKMNQMRDEIKILKEGNDMFQSKVDNIYKNNILIPKKDDGSKKQNTEEKKDQEENVFITNMQEEVRKLHFQL